MSLYTKIIDLQKLGESWKRVKTNKPSAGVDEVTYEEYDLCRKENLKQLHIELLEHKYEPLPVRMVSIYKGEKKREIGLFSMRDKVVQQSIASELLKLYDHRMSDSTFAYRHGKSALEAVQILDEKMKEAELKWVLKADIRHFFDCIPLHNLYRVLEQTIREKDVINLIHCCCETKELQKDGTLRGKNCGLYQGSGIAPVLSNIYLMQFDTDIEAMSRFYVRYSDDILVLGKSEEELEKVKCCMDTRLQMLGLELNKNKTEIKSAREGIVFLGYQLSDIGKAIPDKAENNLSEKLEDIWLNTGLGLEEKLKKGAEVLDGWEQYYRDERKIGSIQEYAIVVYMLRHKKDEILKKVSRQRTDFQNVYREICKYLSAVWRERNDWQMELLEYEQFYGLYGKESCAEESILELCEVYRQLIDHETKELWEDLLQMYSDVGAYNKASTIMGRITAMQNENDKDTNSKGMIFCEEPSDSTFVSEAFINPSFLQQYMKLFAGREDTYGKEELNKGKKRCVEQMAEPLTEDIIKAHIEGKFTASTFVQRSNHTVKYLIIDVDISKRVLLQGSDGETIQKYLPKAAETSRKLLKVLKKIGLKGYLEDSGFRGYHIWLFFTEWIPTRYVSMLTDIIEEDLGKIDTDVTIEYFPNKGKMRNGSFGQSMKLPLGFHVRTGRRSQMMDEDFAPVFVNEEYLGDIAKFSLQAIKKIIGYHSGNEKKEIKEVDSNLEGFGEISEQIRVVLEGCNLMRYLCQKARKTGYLTHFERLSVLYVFGHLGDEGKTFVHTVMEFTLNYQYHVTEKFIQKIPLKPISCIKLRDQYKQITAEYGCSCDFKRTRNCYPSPVLHAIKLSGTVSQDVTVPTSRTLSKEKEKKVVEEINIHKKVQELAGRIIEMKKQKRGIDKAIRKAESELEKIYDQAGIDCLEVDMGLLMRRKTDGAYEWMIEI